MYPDNSLVLKDWYPLFADNDLAISFLKDVDVLNAIPEQCPTCNRAKSTFAEYEQLFRCTYCGYARAYTADTLFFNQKLTVAEILQLLYWFMYKTPIQNVENMLQISRKSIGIWYTKFRRAILLDLADERDVQTAQIGGAGIVVEIDESKFGHKHITATSKLSKDGYWIFGGVEKTAECKLFAVIVPDRTTETLLREIKRHIAPGSIILSDGWAAYNKINDLGIYTHRSVNHSKGFKDPVTGDHTNTIESTWHAIKRTIQWQGYNEDKLMLQIAEFQWRRKNHGQFGSAMLHLLKFMV